MYEYKVKDILIKDIYDGDTIRVTVDLGFGIYKKEKFRLARIDTPEIRGVEREAGLISRDYLRVLLIKHKDNIVIKTIKDRKGKYGRYIAELYIISANKSINVNDLLLAEGLAKLY